MQSSAYLRSAIALSFLLAVYSVVLAFKDASFGKELNTFWGLVFSVLVVQWARREFGARQFDSILDAGFYFVFLLPLALPYYLITTRGLRGIVVFFGLASIYVAPVLLGDVCRLMLNGG